MKYWPKKMKSWDTWKLKCNDDVPTDKIDCFRYSNEDVAVVSPDDHISIEYTSTRIATTSTNLHQTEEQAAKIQSNQGATTRCKRKMLELIGRKPILGKKLLLLWKKKDKAPSSTNENSLISILNLPPSDEALDGSNDSNLHVGLLGVCGRVAADTMIARPVTPDEDEDCIGKLQMELQELQSKVNILNNNLDKANTEKEDAILKLDKLIVEPKSRQNRELALLEIRAMLSSAESTISALSSNEEERSSSEANHLQPYMCFCGDE